ncbi:acyl-CoA dehydrogenase family protein [Sphingobium sp. JS3065]|uniref:acyl-CoA dehydrogenase family protein n=1 Tax=Sphingobium sp. JS3065 TaxID=2970925 RepID=UPI0022649376|nr:acyl-CoA dehydrogenase family protein [Sphingobium sp. JS3065]UZW57512.1 acyl-CoA dehydrogenase family protein [Sphingobium sp. JS3065]
MVELASLGFGRKIFRDDHEAFRETARNFFRSEVEPNVRQWEKDGFYPAELFKVAARYGLLCAGIPEEYGGGGGDVLHHMILHEEHGYSPGGVSLEAGLGTDLTAYVLFNGGTEEQKREWLPFFAQGNGIAEVGLSEPGAGSDARGIKTYARRDGDDWILNGQKMWMSNGPLMTVLFVVAKTDEGGREGTTMFIVPMDSKGITRSQPTDLMMKSCGGVCEVFFDDVRIPASNVLGGPDGVGRGLRIALSTLDLGRASVGVRAIAASELALAVTTDYTRTRQAFGQSVFDFQNTQFKLASVATEIAAGRAFVDSCLEKLVEGGLRPQDMAMLKLFCSEVEGRVMDECLQLHGGAGFSNEYLISKLYAHARVHRIYVGTSEIMKQIIARSL